MSKTVIPVCPIISAGLEKEKLCRQEGCAWYMPSSKTCAVYAMAHNALLDIRMKQIRK